MHNVMWSWKHTHTHTHTHTQTTAVFVYNKSQQTACSLCSVWHIDWILHCDKLNMCPCGALWHCSRMNTHTEERNTIYVVLLFFKTWTKIYIFSWCYECIKMFVSSSDLNVVLNKRHIHLSIYSRIACACSDCSCLKYAHNSFGRHDLTGPSPLVWQLTHGQSPWRRLNEALFGDS